MSGPDKLHTRFSSIEAASDNKDIVEKDTEALWKYAEIEGKRWNKKFPYQLLILEKTKGGYKRTDKQFTLPIPPQSLEIDTGFAINLSATLGGVVEEHNGTPFRSITMTGTTGVLPLKGTPDSLAGRNVGESIIAGTTQAAQNLANEIRRSKAVLDGTNPEEFLNVVPEAEFNDKNSKINKTSGYYQFHLLERFFQYYTTQKKEFEGANLRLALAIWKDRSVYLVTPQLFKCTRNADSPFEYRYVLQFRAWAKVDIDEHNLDTVFTPVTRNPSALASIINKIGQARLIVAGSRKIIEAVGADVENLLTPLRELSLCIKELAGIAISVADLPVEIVRDLKTAVLELASVSSVPGAVGSAFSNVPKEIEREFALFHKQLAELSVSSGKGETGSGSSVDQIKQAKNGPNPINSIFLNPGDYYTLMSAISPRQLKLSPAVQNKILAETERVKGFTRKDFDVRREKIASVMIDFAEAIGEGNAIYNKIYGITPKINANVRAATDADFEILFNLNDILIELNKLCVSEKIDPPTLTNIEYIGSLANQNGIAFTKPVSKYLVPMLYGHSLEQMAQIYLKDVNRWHEIAALNGLREPYIDEVGFDRYLATNGWTNQIQLSDVTNMFVGQSVWISSATISKEKRRVTGIKTISDTVHIVTLSGDADLDKFTTTGGSLVHAYLPDTINSQMCLYIPSQVEAQEEDFQTQQIPGIDYFDNLVRIGGISLLLNSTNDIVLTPYGSSKYVYGLNNIVQKVKIALSTEKGSLLQHPNYGLPLSVGGSTADVDAAEVLRSIQGMFLRDRSFSSVNSILVQKNGPTVSITANFGLAGVNQNIPITVNIKR